MQSPDISCGGFEIQLQITRWCNPGTRPYILIGSLEEP
jgi:hypothetical protein